MDSHNVSCPKDTCNVANESDVNVISDNKGKVEDVRYIYPIKN